MENNNLNGYKAFLNNKELDIYAKDLYSAKLKAIEIFKPKKKDVHMVHVHLCELNGESVIHNADF